MPANSEPKSLITDTKPEKEDLSVNSSSSSTFSDLSDSERFVLQQYKSLFFSKDELLQLHPDNTQIDHRDLYGKWEPASIIEIENDEKNNNQLKYKINYINWSSKWDVWCSLETKSKSFLTIFQKSFEISRKMNMKICFILCS